MSIRLNVIGAFALACVLLAASARAQTVLILDESVSGGINSPESLAAQALGFSVEVVDNAGWMAKSTADFASYRAIILGDPTCVGPTSVPLPAAVATTGVWGPAIDGNVILIGTDNVFHLFQGGQGLVDSGIDFATAAANKTGAYITLSCYYHDTAPNTPVPLLDAFEPGGFTVKGVGCFDDAHIVASHPAVDTLTDAQLSNWGCSVHEAFDNWPKVGLNAFLVLVIAENAGGEYLAPDGTVGTPYILARGEGLVVISDIKLTPEFATNVLGSIHTVTATVTEDGLPVVGTSVQFEIISGPHAGLAAAAATDSNGEATFSYSGSSVGVDTIVATFVDSLGATQTSNQALKEWVSPIATIDNGCPGTQGASSLTVAGTFAPSSVVDLDLTGALPNSTGVLMIGKTPAELQREGCTLLFQPLFLIPIATNGAGAFAIAAHWPAGVASGQTVFLQVYVFDPGTAAGFESSNTIVITTP